MMTKKRMIAGVAVAFALAAMVGCQDSKDFEIRAGVLTKYVGAGTKVKIPSSVTTIGEEAFKGLSITSVSIPKSVTEIGNAAFRECTSLRGVTIPNSVTEIGRGAFSRCTSLTNVSIPKSVTSIEGGAFAECVGLVKITVAFGNSAYTSIDGVLFNADATKLIMYPAEKRLDLCYPIKRYRNWVKRVFGLYAFSGCTGLTGVTIPNSVTEIEQHAFYGCTGLTGVTIPNSVTEIGWATFSGCTSLTSVSFSGSNAAFNANYHVFDGSIPTC